MTRIGPMLLGFMLIHFEDLRASRKHKALQGPKTDKTLQGPTGTTRPCRYQGLVGPYRGLWFL